MKQSKKIWWTNHFVGLTLAIMVGYFFKIVIGSTYFEICAMSFLTWILFNSIMNPQEGNLK